MKPKIDTDISRLKIVAIQATIIIGAVVVLQSCSCEKGLFATNPATNEVNFSAIHELGPGKPGFTTNEGEWCRFWIFEALYQSRFGPTIPLGPPATVNTIDTSAQTKNGERSRLNKSIKLIEGLKPSEHFATTITGGPMVSFKSSNEDYGSGYGKHKPGIGFNLSVGTVLPFNQRWAIAPSIRLTQKNASETIGYSEPVSSSSEFTDKYSYSYVGGSLLGQYRAGKHISLVAGPELNYLVSASVKNSGGEKQSLNKSSQKLGIDMMAGIKFDLPAKSGRSKWGLQFMYDHRLSRLNKKKDESGMEIPAYKMKSLQVGLAYNICGSCGKKR